MSIRLTRKIDKLPSIKPGSVEIYSAIDDSDKFYILPGGLCSNNHWVAAQEIFTSLPDDNLVDIITVDEAESHDKLQVIHKPDSTTLQLYRRSREVNSLTMFTSTAHSAAFFRTLYVRVFGLDILYGTKPLGVFYGSDGFAIMPCIPPSCSLEGW